MQRHNIFNQVHKGLRAMLYDTALTIQQTDFTNPGETEIVVAKIEQVLHVFHSHASKEDNFILPAIEANDKALVSEFESEHETDEILGGQLSELLDSLAEAKEERIKVNTGYELLKAFNSFTAFNLYHMNKEEIKLNKALWVYYTDEEILAIERSIVASIEPQDMQVFSRWMIRGINNAEASKWLKAVKNNAPEFVFNSLLSVAVKELPQERWNTIKESIAESAVPA